MSFETGGVSSALVGRAVYRPILAPKTASQYRRYASASFPDLQRRMQTLPGHVTLSIDPPEDFVGYNEVILRMGGLVLTLGCIEACRGYDLHFKAGDEYIINIPFRGSGWASTGATFIEYSDKDLLVISPLCRVEKHWNGPGEVLSIHIPVDRFDSAVVTLGMSGLSFAPILRIERCRLRSFMRILGMIWEDLQDIDAPSPFLSATLSGQTEEILLHLLVGALQQEVGNGGWVAPLPTDAPSYVRRAKNYVDSNAHFSITLEEIADAARVSVRTVQYGFRRFLKNTPMQYVKMARCQRARRLLQSDRSGRTITDIALEVGYPSVSQFSREYRCLFGETPSSMIAAWRRERIPRLSQ